MSARGTPTDVIVTARRFAVVAHYRCSLNVAASAWRPHQFLPRTWVHPSHPAAVLTGDRYDWRLAFHTNYEGGARKAVARADAIMGLKAYRVAIVPTALRVAVRIVDPALIPSQPRRVARVLPDESSEPCVIDLGGMAVELRLTATTTSSNPVAFCEAVIGGPHVDMDGNPRALMFRDDALRFALQLEPGAVATYLARAAHQLHDLVARRTDLAFDPREVQASRVVVVRTGANGEREFGVALPTSQGKRTFVMPDRPPYIAIPVVYPEGEAA